MSFYDAIRVGASGAVDFEIERSLRFDYTATPQLKRTGSSTSSTYTVSMWYKYTGVGRNELNLIFSLGQSNDANSAFMGINNNDQFILYDGAAGGYQFTSTRVYRDPSAWYHFTLSVNSNSYTIYINNESIDTGTIRSLDTSSDGLRIGIQYGNYYPFNGYIADFYLIDGSALTPSSFTETNAETGQLIPKKYSGSFGTSGAHLLFNDNSGTTATTLGKDSSGNGNNFTPSGFSVAAGSGNDSVIDTPTNNFSTFNPLFGLGTNFGGFPNGNLDHSLAVSQVAASSFLIPPTGKWYAEYVLTAGALLSILGVRNPAIIETNASNGISMMQFTDDGSSLSAAAQVRVDNSYVETLSSSYANNDILGIKVDRDAGTIQFTKNGSNISTAINLSGASDTSDLVFVIARSQSGSYSFAGHANFGQRPFSYLPTGYKSLCSQNLSDPTILLPEKHYNTLVITGNQSTNAVTGLDFQPDWVVYKALNPETGHGETWFHDAIKGPTVRQGIRPYNTTTPPAEVTNSSYLVSFDSNGLTVGNDGVYNNYHQYNQTGRLYQALCWDAGETDGATYTVKVVSDSGNKYRFNDFGTSAVTLDLAEGGTYTFDGSDSSMSGHPFVIGTAANGSVYSTGVTYQLDGASVSYSAYTSGYSSATTRKLIITVPASAPVLYYWCSIHSGMGGQINTNSTLGSSNFAGSTQSRVKVNATAGFSLVSYTGTGSLATVGHGLGVKPDVMIIKNRNSEGHGFLVYHTKIGATKNLQLNTNSPEATASNKFNDTEPTSTVFTVNTSADGNQSSQNFISYIFSEVSGYSKFGSYVGNANANGTYVFCGFEPAFLLIKRSSSGDNSPWIGYNNKRNPFNQVNNQMVWNTTEWENIDANNANLDFVSNGFKLRNSSGGFNGNGGIYIFLAFAHSPFKNGRAR